MTRPIYSQTTLETFSTKELKTIASKIGAIADGDKRVKQTWISAVIDHQTKFSPAKVAAMEAHIETVMNRFEPIPADDEAFAAVMGLTYDDVFGESIEPMQPTDEPQPVAHTPILIPLLAVAIVLLCSMAIVPALVLVSIVVTLGQPQRGATPHPQPNGSSS
jgi:hypothetical protein